MIQNFSFAQKQRAEEKRVINDLILKPINNIVIKGNIVLYLLQSNEPNIYYEGNKSTIKQVKTQINNGVLSITNRNTKDKIEVFLTVENIENIKTLGKVEIKTPTNITINKLVLNISEESEIELFVNSNNLKLDVRGNGELNLAGFIDTLKLTAYNESEIFTNLKSKKVICRTFDNSNLKLKGSIFNLYISSFNNSYVDALYSEVGNCFIIAFDESDVKTTSIEAPEIYAFDKATIYYKSLSQALIMEYALKSYIKKEILKNIVNK